MRARVAAKSTVLATALVVAAASACRREPIVQNSAPAPTSLVGTIPAIAESSRKTPPVIFLGLDGADWQLLDSYIRDGNMPNLAQLVAEGTSGTLETLHPALSPLIWTSMMTGVDPLATGSWISRATSPAPRPRNPSPATSGACRRFGTWRAGEGGRWLCSGCGRHIPPNPSTA